MRELHVVAVSEDGRHVVLAGTRGASRGGFRVALDDRLAAALRGDLPRPGEVGPHVSELTPKQIQTRLRTGESAESIAASAGVPVARVERFSGPVEGEMARMIDAARAAFLVRGRLGRSAAPLGQTVDAAIAAAPSLRPDSAEWSTLREESGSWLVTVTWYAWGRSRRATWRYVPSLKTVTALDPVSATMGYSGSEAAVAPRRPAATGVAVMPATSTPARRAPARKKVPAKSAAPAKAAAGGPAARRAAAGKASPRKAAPRKAAPRKAAAKPASRRVAAKAAAATVSPAKAAPKKTSVPRAAAGRPASARAAVDKAPRKAGSKRGSTGSTSMTARVAAGVAAKPAARARGLRTLTVVPDPEPLTQRPTARERQGPAVGKLNGPAGRAGAKTRASVPGWADVLLGTTPTAPTVDDH